MGPENKEIEVVLSTSTAADSAAVLVREISLQEFGM
jgi:hypothetical protein